VALGAVTGVVVLALLFSPGVTVLDTVGLSAPGRSLGDSPGDTATDADDEHEHEQRVRAGRSRGRELLCEERVSPLRPGGYQRYCAQTRRSPSSKSTRGSQPVASLTFE